MSGAQGPGLPGSSWNHGGPVQQEPELWRGEREKITAAFLFFLPSNLPPLLPLNTIKQEAANMEVWKAQLISLGLRLLSSVPTSAILASRFYQELPLLGPSGLGAVQASSYCSYLGSFHLSFPLSCIGVYK